MSVTTEINVRAEMLTVPGQSACSCEHENWIGASNRTGYFAAISDAIVHAITESVASGRCGPCCSVLPTGSTATRRSRTSTVVSLGNIVLTVVNPVAQRRDLAVGHL